VTSVICGVGLAGLCEEVLWRVSVAAAAAPAYDFGVRLIWAGVSEVFSVLLPFFLLFRFLTVENSCSFLWREPSCVRVGGAVSLASFGCGGAVGRGTVRGTCGAGVVLPVVLGPGTGSSEVRVCGTFV
jgi:hypothetical protein